MDFVERAQATRYTASPNKKKEKDNQENEEPGAKTAEKDLKKSQSGSVDKKQYLPNDRPTYIQLSDKMTSTYKKVYLL